MDTKKIMEYFERTAYTRTGGSREEARCAAYLAACCAELGLDARLEPFAVDMAEIKHAALTVDGRDVPCKGYLCAGSGEAEAPLYYLTGTDPYSLAQCRGKIVLLDGYLGYWKYQDLLENGAVGFLTYDGNANYVDRDIDQRELRSYVSQGRKLPGANINAKDAIALVKGGAARARIALSQEEYQGESQNVVAELPGSRPEVIVFTAHYDSTSLSQGAYDNFSGCVGLLWLAEYFAAHPHDYTLRFVWCGSEERGLLGSKAYCAAHEAELDSIVLNINLDMIGCVMGGFLACCTAEEKLCHYIEYLGAELGFGIKVRQDVYSSDSTPFADRGIPAVSFARIAPGSTATIHNSYDTLALIRPEQMAADCAFLSAFAQRMACAKAMPVARKMPENMKEKLDVYLCRKREDK